MTQELKESRVYKEKPGPLVKLVLLVRKEFKETRVTPEPQVLLELKGFKVSKVRPVQLVLPENRVSKV